MAYTTINKPSSYFNTIIWTGDNTNRTLTGVGFQPDFVWWKQRNGTDDHRLIDSVRGEGTTSYKIIFSNSTSAEYNGNDNGGSQGNINALNSDGFSGAQGTIGWNNWNGSTYNYVAWNWLASNTSGSSNTAGSITSTVAVNTTSGFSIVSYTGTGANATVGHGLGVAPDMIICKSRTQAQNWATYHSSLGNTKAVFLDGTNAATTSSSYWNNTSPTSTVFTVGNSGDVNYNGGTQISYCFSSVRGYSKFGSYTGNGSTDGTFIYTGFKPSFVMVKRSDSTGSWLIHDNKRNTFNVANLWLGANLSNAETTSSDESKDFLSNGWKIRGTGTAQNTSGGTYIYMAFAENPFVSSTQIPTTAR